jgi:CheY-like chemotaxis protein
MFASSPLVAPEWHIATAITVGEAIEHASVLPIDAIVVECCLVGESGLDAIRAIREHHPRVPVVVIGASLPTPLIVEAVALGAAGIIEKPLHIDRFPTRLKTSILHGAAALTGWRSMRPVAAACGEPRSVAQRWARFVVSVCESAGDLPKLSHWARFVGVSYTRLSETCRLLSIRPHDARDFARCLRALVRSLEHGCPPDVLLDVNDRRTLRCLTERAGPAFGSSREPGVLELFLREQRFVSAGNEGVRCVRALLQASPLLGIERYAAS